MEAKALLRRARLADRQLRTVMERRRRCEEIRRTVGDGAGEKLAALEAELARQVEDWAGVQLEVETAIEALPDPMEREVLRYRYLDGLGWNEISRRIGLSKDWLGHCHTRAVRKLKGT